MPDALTFWLVNIDESALSLNLPAPRRSSADVAVRLKNQSSLYVAENITISVEGPSAAQFLVSVDGGQTFAATGQVGNLAPNAVTGAIQLRRVTPSTAALGTHTCTLRAQPAAWTSQ